jgi:hypothetical protein
MDDNLARVEHMDKHRERRCSEPRQIRPRTAITNALFFLTPLIPTHTLPSSFFVSLVRFYTSSNPTHLLLPFT